MNGSRVTVRVPQGTLERLDELAAARRLSRSTMLRALVDDATLTRAGEVPDERELLVILAERARAGNVSAIKMLLDREAVRDPAELEFEAAFGGNG